MNEVEKVIPQETVEELFDQAPCGYLSVLADGRIAKANQTFLSWTGYDRSALLSGTHFRDLLTVPGKVFHDTHYGPLLQMQGFVKEVTFDILCPGRDPLPVLVNAVRKNTPQGHPSIT